jgi:hypothetical protein
MVFTMLVRPISGLRKPTFSLSRRSVVYAPFFLFPEICDFNKVFNPLLPDVRPFIKFAVLSGGLSHSFLWRSKPACGYFFEKTQFYEKLSPSGRVLSPDVNLW